MGSPDFSEGLLLDLLIKRRAGKFTAAEIGWAADNIDLVRWLMANTDVAKGLMDKRPEAVEKQVGLVPAKKTFTALVTYTQPSLAELKQKFDWVNSNIAKAYFKPIKRCKKVSHETREIAFEYVHLGREASTDEIFFEMDRQGLRPAFYEELLAFGAKYPDEQRQLPIVALGSVSRDWLKRLYVACLEENGSNRDLNLDSFERVWGSRYRFLAVRKETETSSEPVHTIDCDADPYLPSGWKVEEHHKGGQFVWDPAKVVLHLSPNQQSGKVIEGHKLQKELVNLPNLNANVLDYLLSYPELIPESWKGKAIFFWGTIYRRAGGSLCVRYLCWNGKQWLWGSYWLSIDWLSYNPAAVSESV